MGTEIDLLELIERLRKTTDNDFIFILLILFVFFGLITFLYFKLKISKENDKREIINTVQDMLVNDSKQYREYISNEVKEQKSELQKLKEERLSLLRRIELLEIELRYANIQIGNNKQAQEKLDEMHKRLEQLQLMLNEFKLDVQKLKEDNERLQSELDLKLTYINSLEEQIVKLKEEINERDERIIASSDQSTDAAD